MKQDATHERIDGGGTRPPVSGWLRSKVKRLRWSLSTKLLIITALFVMIVQLMIFVPSVASYRKEWLMQRVVAAKIASLSVDASQGAELPEMLRQELLRTAGVHAVSLKRPNVRRLVLGMPEREVIDDVFDLRNPGAWELVQDSLAAFIAPPGRLVRVIGSPEMMPEDQIDIVIDETPLRAALWAFTGNIFWVSLLIAISTAALVYVTLNTLLVQPMMRLTRSMVSYRENPEDRTRIITPSGRSDEIGVAELELASLQRELTAFLSEKARLATIGLAVSKINHDLRNMLASAQLVSDRLTTVADPTVQRFAPRLIRALDRAIALCVDILKYGRSEEPAPKRMVFAFEPLVADVIESLGAEGDGGVELDVDVMPGMAVWADRDHLHRVLVNLVRNAFDALNARHDFSEAGKIGISALVDDGVAIIRIRDNGPGLSPEAQNKLFQPFQTSRRYGTGLGLVIAWELVRAHGGDIGLEATSDKGATFLIRLPQKRDMDAPAMAESVTAAR